MKELWCDLLREDYIHVETFRCLWEHHPQMMMEFKDWLGIPLNDTRVIASKGLLPCEWMRMFLMKESSNTASFKMSIISTTIKAAISS